MKPYAFVQLSQKVQRTALRPRNTLDPSLHHGKWIIRGRTLTPLIVRSGRILLHNDRLVHGPTLQNGHPVLPGSSLKGVVRSIYEAVSHSCIDKPSGTKGDPLKHLPVEKRVACSNHEEGLCPACQVFGCIGKNIAKSLVSFSDFFLQGAPSDWLQIQLIPPLYRPRLDKALHFYLDDEDMFQRKFYFHGAPEVKRGSPMLVLKQGAILEGEIHYQQLTDEELGRLAFSFGFGDPAFALKVGYAKPAYLGSIQFELIHIQPYERLGFRSREIQPEDILKFSRLFQEEMRVQIEQLLNVLDYEKNRNRAWTVNQQGQKGY